MRSSSKNIFTATMSNWREQDTFRWETSHSLKIWWKWRINDVFEFFHTTTEFCVSAAWREELMWLCKYWMTQDKSTRLTVWLQQWSWERWYTVNVWVSSLKCENLKSVHCCYTE